MKLTVHAFTTLDGVMQGPGGPDEDRSDGFALGGWMAALSEVSTGWAQVVDGWFQTGDEFLLGRSTYEMMAAYWSLVTDPDNGVGVALNTRPKHVVTRTLTQPEWQNTTVVDGDLAAAVRDLKARPGTELQVHGSWQLVQALHRLDLVDEYRVLTFPVVLGRGKRLFHAGARPSGMDVVEVHDTGGGIAYSVLRPTAAHAAGTFAVQDGHEVALPS